MDNIPTQFILTLFVELRDGTDAVVGERAQDLDDGLFIGAQSGDGVMQLFGVELRQGRHQGHDDVFELAAQLALQLGDEVLAVGSLEGFGDLETLNDSSAGQHVDDGLLVGTEALHGLLKGGRIGHGVEGVGWVNGGCTLKEVKPITSIKYTMMVKCMQCRGK